MPDDHLIDKSGEEVMQAWKEINAVIAAHEWRRSSILRALYTIISDSLAPLHNEPELLVRMLGDMNVQVTARITSQICKGKLRLARALAAQNQANEEPE